MLPLLFLPILGLLPSLTSAQALCSATNKCPASSPCCSQYGYCGAASATHCFYSCDPAASFSPSSCRPNPICKKGSFNFGSAPSTSSGTVPRIAATPDQFNNDADSYDFWVGQGALQSTPNSVLLPITQAGALGQGTLLSSARYMNYGIFSVTLKATSHAGLVSSAILFSDMKDEVDWEWPGNKTNEVQSNVFEAGASPSAQFFALPASGNRTATYFTYTMDWSVDRIVWSINGVVQRTLLRSTNPATYPSTPSRVSFSTWNASPNSGAINDWAGGLTVWDSPQYASEIQSVQIDCYDTAQQPAGSTSYRYVDTVGTIAYSNDPLVYVAPPPSQSTSTSSTTSPSTSPSPSASTCADLSSDATCNVLVKACVATKSSTNPWSKSSCVAAAVCAGPNRVLSQFACAGLTSPAQSSLSMDYTSIYAPIVGQCAWSPSGCGLSSSAFMNFYYAQLSAAATSVWPSSTSQVTRYWDGVSAWAGYSNGAVPYLNMQDYLRYYKASATTTSTTTSPATCPAISTLTYVNDVVNLCVRIGNLQKPFGLHECLVAAILVKPAVLLNYWACKNNAAAPARSSISLDYTNAYAPLVGSCAWVPNGCSLTSQNVIDAVYGAVGEAGTNNWPSSGSEIVTSHWLSVYVWAAFPNGNVPFPNLQDWLKWSS